MAGGGRRVIYATWFAKGFLARCRSVDVAFPLGLISGECTFAWQEGWRYAAGLFRVNLEPYTVEEVEVLEKTFLSKAAPRRSLLQSRKNSLAVGGVESV